MIRPPAANPLNSNANGNSKRTISPRPPSRVAPPAGARGTLSRRGFEAHSKHAGGRAGAARGGAHAAGPRGGGDLRDGYACYLSMELGGTRTNRTECESG